MGGILLLKLFFLFFGGGAGGASSAGTWAWGSDFRLAPILSFGADFGAGGDRSHGGGAIWIHRTT